MGKNKLRVRMPPRSKSRPSSVAQELVLALSKPKIAKDDNKNKSSNSTVTKKNEVKRQASSQVVKKENASPVKNSDVNKDWISFLKNKQEDAGPVIKDVRSISKAKSKSLPDPVPKQVKKESVTPSKSSSNDNVKIKEDPDKSNGKVLQSLMTQVSTLESTFGDKVSKLEASLKIERSKSKQLEANLEKEDKHSPTRKRPSRQRSSVKDCESLSRIGKRETKKHGRFRKVFTIQ